jgi:hypothetical protein
MVGARPLCEAERRRLDVHVTEVLYRRLGVLHSDLSLNDAVRLTSDGRSSMTSQRWS